MISLGEVITILKGSKASEVFDEQQPGAFPYLQIEDLRPDAIPKYAHDEQGVLATEKDVLIAWDGANAGTVGFGLRGYAGSTIAVLRPNRDDIYGPYLGYYLYSKFDDIQANSTGATIPHLRRDYLESLSVPLPLLLKQKSIVALLAKADYLRAKRRYAKYIGEMFLQSVFVKIFGEPTRNSKGWDIVKIEAILSKSRNGIQTGPFGSALKKHEYVSSGIPVWGINNLQGNKFIEEDSLFITNSKYKELSKYSAENGDIFVSRAGTVGKMCVAYPTHPQSIIGTNLIRISLDFSVIIPEYFASLFTYFGTSFGSLKMTDDENAYSFINPTVFKTMRIPIPPLSAQKLYANIVSHHKYLSAKQCEAERQAELLFQTLLEKSFRVEL